MNCTLLSFPFLPHFSLYHPMDKKLTFTHMYVCTYRTYVRIRTPIFYITLAL
jgi:hypothetical protein